MDQKIPKIIHYCWFGGNPKPPLVLKCIDSWKRYCPDYEIIEWNEETFDIHSNVFVEEAYQARKWAFVADYVRLYSLFNYGGIYLDSDVEVFRSLDTFLAENAFTGFEAKDAPVTAIMGCRKGDPLFGKLLDYYTDRHFITDGIMDDTPNTIIITDIMLKNGIKLNGKKQTIQGCTVYPEIAFCPNNFLKVFNRYSSKTYCAHHFMGSWGSNPVTGERSLGSRFKMYLIHAGRNLIGTHRMYVMGQALRKVMRRGNVID